MGNSVRHLFLLKELRLIFILALPIVFTSISFPIFANINIALFRYFSIEELASYGIALSFQQSWIKICEGLLVGTRILVSKNLSKNNKEKSLSTLSNALILSIILSIIGFYIFLFGESILAKVGVSYEIAKRSGEYLSILKWSLLPLFFYITFSYYLEGCKKPLYITYSTWISNILSVFLLFFLIHWAEYKNSNLIPISLSISRISMFLIIVFLCKGEILYLLKNFKWKFSAFIYLIKVGISSGVMCGSQTASSFMLNLMVSKLGDLAFSAYQIQSHISSLFSLVNSAFASASGILVTYLDYKHDRRSIKNTIFSFLLLISLLNAIFIVFYIYCLDIILIIYSKDIYINDIVKSCALLLMILIYAEAIQSLFISILCHLGDPYVSPLIKTFFSWFAVFLAYIAIYEFSLNNLLYIFYISLISTFIPLFFFANRILAVINDLNPENRASGAGSESVRPI